MVPCLQICIYHQGMFYYLNPKIYVLIVYLRRSWKTGYQQSDNFSLKAVLLQRDLGQSVPFASKALFKSLAL